MSADPSPDQKMLIDGLLDDVQRSARSAPYDLIVFTGDLAATGLRVELDLARQSLIDPLLDRTGLSLDRLIVVPGNHDIDRRKIKDFVETGLQRQLAGRVAVNALMNEPPSVALATERLSDWQEFHQDLYAGCLPASVGPLGYVHRSSIGGTSVSVAALNSAWRASGGENDRRRLLIGEAQTRECVDALRESSIRVVAMHHPLDWIADFDADDAQFIFERAGTLVLTGHLHRSDPVLIASTRGAALYGQVGCLYEDREYLNSYATIDLNLATRKVVVRLRTWWRDRHTFDEATNVAPHGEFHAALPEPMGLVSDAPVTRVVGALRERAAETSIIPRSVDGEGVALRDLLVPPRLFTVPHREAILSANPDRTTDIPRIDPDVLLSEHRVIIISGEAESGLTSSLFWFLERDFLTRGLRYPVFMPFDHRFDRNHASRAVEAAHVAADDASNAADGTPAMFAIDDVSSGHSKAAARLVQYILEKDGHSFLLGCHGEEHATLAAALSNAQIEFARVFLAPFGRRELRMLAANLLGPGTDEIVDRVLGVIRRQSLPRSPFVMAMLVAILARQGDLAEINETGLLVAYIEFLLSEGDVDEADGLAMDARRREHVLGALAGELTRADVEQWSRLETEAFLATYFQNKAWINASPGRTLDSLVARRVLRQQGNLIGFRHPALAAVFAAKWMEDDPSFARFVISERLKYAAVIRHSAALKRNDQQLLVEVREMALNAIAEISSQVSVGMFDHIGEREGWIDEPTLDGLKAQIAVPDAKPDRDELDRELDRLDDQREVTEEPSFALNAALSDLAAATQLLSEVLKSSELVDDVPLKVQCLKDAIHDWSLLAVVFAVREEQTAAYRELLEPVFKSIQQSESENRDLVDRFMTTFITLMTGFIAVASLGSTRLGGVVEIVMRDDEFMEPAAHAYFATLLYSALQLKDWPEALYNLYEKHHRHPLVGLVTRCVMMTEYRARTTSERDLGRLQKRLADIYTSDAKRRGPGAAQAYAQQRGEVIRWLRESRQDARRETAMATEQLLGDELEGST
jgi:hypothetical protein